MPTIHADRGASMVSRPVAFLLADLGVTKSHSRPHCSNGNPYSEAWFKALKYRPELPDRFGCHEDPSSFFRRFFCWCNEEHRHSGSGPHPSADVHHRWAEQVRAVRFVREPPAPPKQPTIAWISQPTGEAVSTTNP